MKRILLAIGFILLVVLVLGFISPKEFLVERSIEIEAPRSHVYEYIKSLEDLHLWTDLKFEDSTLQIAYHGTPGTVGSRAEWKRVDVIEEGTEEVVRVVPLNRMETNIRMVRPWESLSHAFFSIGGNDDVCKMTWRFEGHCPFPFNIRHLFIDMDYIQGTAHDASLKKLKAIAEKDFVIQSLGVKRERLPKITCPIQHMTVAAFDYPVVPSPQVQLEKDEKTENSTPPAVFIQNMRPDSISLSFCRDLENPDGKVDLIYTRDSTEAIVVSYVGSYKGLITKHKEIKKYIQSEGWNIIWPVWEEYSIHAGNEPDTAKWLTKIHYSIEE